MSSAIEGKDGKLVTTGGVTVVAAAAAAAEQQLPTALLRGTDMQCGVVGFGCASLGGVYGPADVTTCREAVAEALALGVKAVDLINEGDVVQITEHKPISKSKSWVVTKVVSKGQE